MTTCKRCAGMYRCNCSRRSSPKVKAHLKSIASAGGKKSALARRIKSWQKWTALVKGMTVQQAWRYVYLQGYRNGYERRRREEGRSYRRAA
jgi:hypothetical protein